MKIESWVVRDLIQKDYARKSLITKIVIAIGIFVSILSFALRIAPINQIAEIKIIGIFSTAITFLALGLNYLCFQLEKNVRLNLVSKKIEESKDHLIELDDLKKHFLTFNDDFF